MDLEATGLFPQDPLNPLNSALMAGDGFRNFSSLLSSFIISSSLRDAPRITEVSFVAVSRKQVENAIRHSNFVSSSDLHQPVHQIVRLPCDIHTRQINPGLNEAEWREYEIRRLQSSAIHYSREDLTEKNTFAVEWKGIELFLQDLPKPLCIFAHNGVKYDFRILYAELARINKLQSAPFTDEIYFVDTYIMFMDVEKKLHSDLRMLAEFIDWRRVFVKAEAKELCMQQTISRPSKQQKGAEGLPDEEQSRRFDDSEKIVEDSITIPKDVQLYHTPERPLREPKCASEPEKSRRRRLFADDDDHPLQFIRTTSWSPAKKIRIRSNFFRRNANGDWQFDNHLAVQYFHEKKVFRLEDMYRQITNRNFDAHHAQDDCEALLQVCIAYGQDFLDYTDKYASKFPILNFT